jgi:conjugal transfer/entry exclusion protein
MTERIETLEQQLAESEAAATEARHRASEAEERATERIDGLTTTAHLRDETTAGGEVSGDRATVSQLEEALQVIRS